MMNRIPCWDCCLYHDKKAWDWTNQECSSASFGLNHDASRSLATKTVQGNPCKGNNCLLFSISEVARAKQHQRRIGEGEYAASTHHILLCWVKHAKPSQRLVCDLGVNTKANISFGTYQTCLIIDGRSRKRWSIKRIEDGSIIRL